MIWADRRILPKREIGLLRSLPDFAVSFEVWKKANEFQSKGQNPCLDKLLTLPSYGPLAGTLPRYVNNVSAIIGSSEVGVAEAIWALTCGRLGDETLKGMVSLFDGGQARYFCSAIDAGESSRLRKYFEQGATR